MQSVLIFKCTYLFTELDIKNLKLLCIHILFCLKLLPVYPSKRNLFIEQKLVTVYKIVYSASCNIHNCMFFFCCFFNEIIVQYLHKNGLYCDYNTVSLSMKPHSLKNLSISLMMNVFSLKKCLWLQPGRSGNPLAMKNGTLQGSPWL